MNVSLDNGSLCATCRVPLRGDGKLDPALTDTHAREREAAAAGAHRCCSIEGGNQLRNLNQPYINILQKNPSDSDLTKIPTNPQSRVKQSNSKGREGVGGSDKGRGQRF